MINDNIKLLKELTEKLTVKDEALIKSEFRFRALFNNLPIFIYELNLEGKIISINPYALNTIDMKEFDVIGLDFINFISKEDEERVLELINDVKGGEEVEFMFKSFKDRIYQSSLAPITVAGKVTKIIGYNMDITEKIEKDKYYFLIVIY